MVSVGGCYFAYSHPLDFSRLPRRVAADWATILPDIRGMLTHNRVVYLSFSPSVTKNGTPEWERGDRGRMDPVPGKYQRPPTWEYPTSTCGLQCQLRGRSLGSKATHSVRRCRPPCHRTPGGNERDERK